MKYRVLKEMVGQSGTLYRPSAVIVKNRELNEDEAAFYGSLVRYGFIEEIKDEPWKPKPGQRVHCVLEHGKVDSFVWFNEESYLQMLAIGNCFQTEDQAEKAVEWLKAFKVLRDDAKGFKPNWEDDHQYKYAVWYNHTTKELGLDERIDGQEAIIYFATAADAKESIKKHEKEWLTFLNIEERE